MTAENKSWIWFGVLFGGVVALYIFCIGLFYIHGSPCASFDCDVLFRLSYMPAQSYWAKLKELNIHGADLYSFFILVSSNYIMIFIISITIYIINTMDKRMFLLPNRTIKQGICISFTTFMFFIVFINFSGYNFTEQFDIIQPTVKLPMAFSISLILMFAFSTSVAAGFSMWMSAIAIGKWRRKRERSHNLGGEQ